MPRFLGIMPKFTRNERRLIRRLVALYIESVLPDCESKGYPVDYGHEITTDSLMSGKKGDFEKLPDAGKRELRSILTDVYPNSKKVTAALHIAFRNV